MRPASIVKFERVVLLIVVISLASAVLAWEQTTAMLAAQGVGEAVLLGFVAALLGLILLLALLVSRRRSNVARWLYVLLVLVLLGVSAPAVPQLIEGSIVNLVLNIAYALLFVVSVLLLFRADARAWLSPGKETPVA